LNVGRFDNNSTYQWHHLSAERDADDYFPADSWARYLAYLEDCRDNLPRTAYLLSTSSWWYAFNDPKAPHDSRLERLEIGDVLDYEREDGVLCWIRVHLVSALTGRITLFYPRVYTYCLAMESGMQAVHGDWRYDEITSDGTPGKFIHTIEWASGPKWVITASDIHHEYRQTEQDSGGKSAAPPSRS
jgi:hypothetical protein